MRRDGRQHAHTHTLISIRDDKSSELKDERWTATGKRPRAEVWRYRLIPVPPPLIDNMMGQDRWFCSNLKVTRKLDSNYNAQPHFIGSVRGIVIRISYKRDLSNWKLEFDISGFAYDLCCQLTEPFDYYPSCGQVVGRTCGRGNSRRSLLTCMLRWWLNMRSVCCQSPNGNNRQ